MILVSMFFSIPSFPANQRPDYFIPRAIDKRPSHLEIKAPGPEQNDGIFTVRLIQLAPICFLLTRKPLHREESKDIKLPRDSV